MSRYEVWEEIEVGSDDLTRVAEDVDLTFATWMVQNPPEGLKRYIYDEQGMEVAPLVHYPPERGTNPMNMTDLYDLQKQLDAKIIENRGLQGKDLMENLVVALQTEIGEMANEWRGFKHWSKVQTPVLAECEACSGAGRHYFGGDEEQCESCEGKGGFPQRLLEEYADCLRFALAIANAAGYDDNDLYTTDDPLEEETAELFNEMWNWVSWFRFVKDRTEKKNCFKNFLHVFLNIGLQRFGFTWDQITAAYLAKNKINHDRQASGY